MHGIFYEFGAKEYVQNIYLIAIFYSLIRWFFITCIYNKKDIIDWKREFSIFFVMLAVDLFLYKFFILKTNKIFVTIDEFRNALWIGIITFLFVIIRDIIYNYSLVNVDRAESIKKNYIIKMYKKFNRKYGKIIKTKDKNLRNIVYAIMIYEDFNRPYLTRIIEYIKLWMKKETTVGIMQVKTKHYINDFESVTIGYHKIKEKYYKVKNESYSKNETLFEAEMKAMYETINDYNSGENYFGNVVYIKEILDVNL